MPDSPPHAPVRGGSCSHEADARHRRPRGRLGRRALRGRRPRPRRAAPSGPRRAGRRPRVGPRLGRAAGGVAGHRGHLRRPRCPPSGRRRRDGLRARGLRAPGRGGHRLVVLLGRRGGRTGGVAHRRLLRRPPHRQWPRGRGGRSRGHDGGRGGGQCPRPAGDGARAVGPRSPARRAHARRGGERAPVGAGRQLDTLRAARVAGHRDSGQPADALLRGLGGRRPPGRRLLRSAPPTAARDGGRLRRRGRPLPRPRGGHGGGPRRRARLDGPPGRPHAARARRRGQRAHRGRRRPAHRGHDQRLRRRRHAPGRRPGGRRLDAARHGAARSAARRHRRGEHLHPGRAGGGARRRRPDRARDLDGLRRRLRRRHRRGGAAARRAPARHRRAVAGARGRRPRLLGPYVAAPAGIALLALAFVSARAGGAAWRGSSAAAGCRAGRSLEEAPASRSAG